jgi:hypothetical protein
MGERGGREIRLTKSEYDQSQHELCLTLAQMVWGDKGLVESLGHTWFMVMDPRFAKCEKTWYKKQKITASSNNASSGVQETGNLIIDDTGNLSAPRLMSLEQYAEILGESRHYIEMLNQQRENEIDSMDPRSVKDWPESDLIAFIKNESPNYFTQKGEPNELARTWVKMFQEDILGLIMDYSEVSNIDQWVFVNTGDVAPRTERADPDNPIVHAEVEYLDRALTYRTMLRANVIKIMAKLGGNKLSEMIDGVELTEFEKDGILQEALSHPYDELYKSLPVVMSLLQNAKEVPFQEREDLQLGVFRQRATSMTDRIKSGELKPIDLLDGESFTEESERFGKIQHDEHLVTLFYVLTQAEEMAKAYPGFSAIVEIVQPLVELAEPIEDTAFEELCTRIQTLADEAIKDAEICDEEV